MKSTTTTSLRKELFGVIEKAVRSVPTRIHSRKGDAVILSYRQYLALKGKKGTRRPGALEPLVKGRIKGALDEHSEAELLKYMGLK